LNPDFLDMLSAFSEERVEFLVVDAYALAVHGLPRATGDMDLWVRPTLGNARRVRAALARFGAPIEGLSEADLITPGTVFQIGVSPRRIDVARRRSRDPGGRADRADPDQEGDGARKGSSGRRMARRARSLRTQYSKKGATTCGDSVK